MKKKILYLFVVACCAMVLSSCKKDEIELVTVDFVNTTGYAEGDGTGYHTVQTSSFADNETITAERDRNESPENEEMIYVFIYGEVNRQGVYEIEKGTRLYEVVNLAGGYTTLAEISYLNLARQVSDGEQIFVPTVEEALAIYESREVMENSGASGYHEGSNSDSGYNVDASVKKVNLNTATKAELMTLSGVGESRANDIISYRNQYGPFRSIEEIQNVPGIKSGIYEKIKDYIIV